VECGDPFAKALKDSNDGRAFVGTSQPNGIGKKIEDFATKTALVIDYARTALLLVRRLIAGKSYTTRAMQSFRMEQLHQGVVTLCFVKQMGDGKLHHKQTHGRGRGKI